MSDLSSLSDDIRQEISRSGRITFARYMELALYAPGKGYYAGSVSGFSGSDYVTSPLAHPVFGALIGRQAYQIWVIMGRPDEFLILEQGAGNGALACDVLDFLRYATPDFYESLSYLAIDCTSNPFGKQQSHQNLQYVNSYTLPILGGVGCVISNELIDAYPVHRFRVQDGILTEAYVQIGEQGEFIEIFDEPSTDLIQARLQDLDIPIQDGLNGEMNLHIDDWARAVAACLDRGIVITIDYGDWAKPLYNRPVGTLQTYYRQTQAGNPLKMVGKKDITAHADFTSLINAGAEYGLEYLGLLEQGQFLRNLGWDKCFQVVSRMGFSHQELIANQVGLRHLVDPAYLGGLSVLIQSKNFDMGEQLWGVVRGESSGTFTDQEVAAIPAMSESHVRYQGHGYTFQEGGDWGYQRFL